MHYSRVMSSENAPKKMMDENQQPSVIRGRLFPSSIRDRRRRGESSELFRVGADESSASATDTNNTTFAT